MMKRVPLLEGAEGWELWKTRVQSLLLEKGYYVLEETGTTFILVPKYAYRASRLLKLFLGDGPLVYVRSIHDPDLIIRTLQGLYEPIGPTYDFLLLKELYSTTLGTSLGVEDYLLKIKKLDSDLRSRGILFPEKGLVGQVLFNLTPDFDFVVASINQSLRQGETISLERIMSQIQDEARRLSLSSSSPDVQMSMNTRASRGSHPPRASSSSRPSRPIASSSSSSSRICSYCKKSGHLVDNCFQKYPQKKKKAPRAYLSQDLDQSSSYGEIEEEEEEEEVEELEEEPLISLEEEEVVLLAKSTKSEEWILDSGATSHFSFDRDIFISLERCSTPILQGKAKKLTALGRGTVRTSFRGKKILLKNVLYLPELGVNLLSTYKLIQSGCEVELGKNAPILRRNGGILARGSYKGNLAIIPTVATPNSTTRSQPSSRKNTRRGFQTLLLRKPKVQLGVKLLKPWKLQVIFLQKNQERLSVILLENQERVLGYPY